MIDADLIREDLIREALTLQAERAPDTNEVLRAVRHRVAEQRRRRSRQRVVLAVAAVAVAAVAGPTAVTAMRHRDVAATVPASGGGAVTTAEVPQDVPLLYEPTWLPAGLHEATAGGTFTTLSVTRRYVQGAAEPDDPSAGTLTMTVTVDDDVAARGVPGVASAVGQDNTTSGALETPPSRWLTWTPEQGVRVDLLAANLGLDDATLRRVAASIVTTGERRALPLRVGWWPDGATPTGATVPAPGRAGTATIAAGAVTVTLGSTGSGRTPASTVLVGGRRASVFRTGSTLSLEVPLAPGRVLTVSSNPAHPSWKDRVPLDVADLARIAQSTQLTRS